MQIFSGVTAPIRKRFTQVSLLSNGITSTLSKATFSAKTTSEKRENFSLNNNKVYSEDYKKSPRLDRISGITMSERVC